MHQTLEQTMQGPKQGHDFRPAKLDYSPDSSGDATPGRARAYALVVNASDLKMTWW